MHLLFKHENIQMIKIRRIYRFTTTSGVIEDISFDDSCYPRYITLYNSLKVPKVDSARKTKYLSDTPIFSGTPKFPPSNKHSFRKTFSIFFRLWRWSPLYYIWYVLHLTLQTSVYIRMAFMYVKIWKPQFINILRIKT